MVNLFFYGKLNVRMFLMPLDVFTSSIDNRNSFVKKILTLS